MIETDIFGNPLYTKEELKKQEKEKKEKERVLNNKKAYLKNDIKNILKYLFDEISKDDEEVETDEEGDYEDEE